MSFVRRVGITFTTQISIYIISLIASIITARMLGPSGKGQIAAAMAIFSIVLQFVHLGLTQGLLYKGARDETDGKRAAFFAILLSLTNGIVGTIILLLLEYSGFGATRNIPEKALIFLAAGMPFSLLIMYAGSVLLAREYIGPMNVVNLSAEIIRLAGLFVLMAIGSFTTLNVILLWLITSILTSLISLLSLKFKIGFSFKLEIDYLKKIAVVGLRFYILDALIFLLLRSDIVLLNYLRNSYEVGIYSIAVTLADRVLLTPRIVGTILLPRVVKQAEGTRDFQNMVSRMTSLMMGVILLVVLIFANPVILLLYGKSFAPSFVPLMILLPGIFFLGLNSILMPHFVAKAYPPISFIAPSVGLLLNVVGNVVLIPLFGYVAAALTSSFGYGVMYFVFALSYKKETGTKLHELLLPKKEDIFLLFERLKGWRT